MSANAPLSGGSFVTKPIVFKGKELQLNFSSSAAGGVRVEILDEHGNAMPGYTQADGGDIFGDAINRTVYWGDKGSDVSELAGKIIRLRFILCDADLFAFQFK